MQTDILIVGAGPVGLFSIFQAGMLGMNCCVVDSLETIGGQCNALYPEKPIYDIPAYPKILGADLIKQLQEQAEPFKPLYYLNQQVTKLEKQDGIFKVTTSLGGTLSTKIIVIAAGCGSFGPNRPPLARLEEFEEKSVFYSVKSRESFAGKTIVIAGGGDSALDWAISLSEIAKKIYLVHRRDKFKALPESVKKAKQISETGRIEFVIGYQLERLIGNGTLEAVEVKDFSNNKKILPSTALLSFFGLSQELGPIAEWGLNLNHKHIAVDNTYFRTNIENIYAIGDIATYPGKLKLILTGFAEGASAMHHAYNKVFSDKPLHFEYSTTKGIPKL